MPIPLDAPEILNREFLQIRAKLLEVGAALDRLSRAAGSVDSDPRMGQIRRILTVLSEADGDRAEQIQLICSRIYDPDWQTAFSLRPRS